jgi:methylthioribose-1-phosphate isomerase
MIGPGVDTIRWAADGRAIEILDQTLLPREARHIRLEDAAAVIEAVRALRVRGAPAIGVAVAMGLALELARHTGEPRAAFLRRVEETYALLLGARPTAVNARWALDRLRGVATAVAADGADNGVIACKLYGEATSILEEDRAMCLRIGEHGAPLLPDDGLAVLTHCNAGALATAGIGTALAPLYVAHAAGRAVPVIACETRPLLQGSRITVWELARAGIDATLITDSTAAAAMAAGRVGAVLVGADRIAANGDVANKVGTYALAVLARYHDIPFYVAAPASTFDAAAASGAAIPIEARDGGEVRGGFGRATAPPDVAVFAPAFDVTPAALVTAMITDRGVLRPPFAPGIAAFTGADGVASAGGDPALNT